MCNTTDSAKPKFHAVQAGRFWRINKDSLFKYAGIVPGQLEGAEELPTMLSIEQTAAILGLSQRTVNRLCHEMQDALKQDAANRDAA